MFELAGSGCKANRKCKLPWCPISTFWCFDIHALKGQPSANHAGEFPLGSIGGVGALALLVPLWRKDVSGIEAYWAELSQQPDRHLLRLAGIDTSCFGLSLVGDP